MQHKVTKNHIYSLNELISEKLHTKLKDNEINDILTNINELLDIDTIQTIHNKEIQTKHLSIFNLINEYHKAYQLSEDTEKEQRTNTLESLDKRNANRKKRFENNKIKLKDKNIHWTSRLVVYYENLLLRYIFKGKQKTAYLLLSIIFINKSFYMYHFNHIFKYSNIIKTSLIKFEESLNFFSFTYLAPSKIVVSISILLYQYLKKYTELQDDKVLKFIRYIVNFYFKKDAPSRIQEQYFKREIYCAGIYNNLPIFQWYTSTKKDEYYSNKDIKRLQIFYNKSLHSLKNLAPFINAYFGENKKEILKPTTQDIKNIIKNLPKKYLEIEQLKLNTKLDIKPKKTLKYYLYSPLRLIITVLIALYTKFAL